MNKAVTIENSTKEVARVLCIADLLAINIQHNY